MTASHIGPSIPSPKDVKAAHPGRLVPRQHRLVQTLRCLVSELDAGPDPMRVDAGVADFTRVHVRTLKPRTQIAYDEALCRFAVTLGHLTLGDLSPDDIGVHLASLTPGTLPAHFSAISSCLNWLDVHGHPGVASVLPKRRPKSVRRMAYVPKTRIGDLFGAYAIAHREHWARSRTLDVCLLCTLVPLRLGEAASLRWCEVDTHSGVVQLPDTKTGHRWLPLGKLGAAIIGTRLTDSEYVFAPTRATPSSHISASGISHAFKRIVRRSFDPADPLQAVCFHSLRHSWASYALTSGVPFEHVRRILGHGSAYATERYAHLTSHEMRSSLESVQRSMAGAMSRQMPLAWQEVQS